MTDKPSPSRVAQVCRLLNETAAEYLVVGATAMQLWGTTRSTRDVDILIRPTVENAERVLEALGHLPFQVARDLLPSDLLSRHVTMIGDTPNVDVLTRAWNVRWDDAAKDIAIFTIDGVHVPTVSLQTLIETKRTGRPQDVADVLLLEDIQRRSR